MIYNPLDTFYKSTVGAVREGENITFRVKASYSCTFCVQKEGEEQMFYQMEKEGDFYKTEISFSCGLYFYYFIADGKTVKCNDDYLGTFDGYENFLLLSYKRDFTVPEWINGGIIYQIFPDRFCREEKDKPEINGRILRKDWGGIPTFLPDKNGKVLNNDFFGGDIKGIISKLSYLKELNVSAIYLNPIFKANSNHRYDTGDYMQIDPFLGTENDLINLINKADEQGIKIILDGVFNHTGDDSVYFNKYGNYDSLGAYQSKDSKYYGWYNFTDYPEEYDSWWGVKILPSVNEDNPDYVRFITGENGVIDKYIKMGVGGFRLDVVDELPDKFVKEIRKSVKKANKNAMLIGEVWEDASDKVSYGKRREYFWGKELDSVMNYPLKNAIIEYVKRGDCKNLSRVIKSQIDRYPFKVLNALMNILSTHDTVRLLSAVGSEYLGKSKNELKDYSLSETELKDAVKKLKIAVLLSYTLCGVPSVYYGEERGMQGYFDPLNRKCVDWENCNTEILSWYKKLGEIRSEYDAFNDGQFQEIISVRGVFSFMRKGKNSEVLVAVNLSKEECNINFDGELYDLIGCKTYKNNLKLKEDECAVLINR